MSYYRDIRNEMARVPERDLNPPDDVGFEPTDADLKQAREELAEQVSAGKKVGRIDLEAALDAEMNADERVFLADLTTLLGGLYQDYSCASAHWLRCVAYVERIAARHIADDDVMDRAIANLNERDV